MQTASTFVGWDFANVWGIEGTYYPLLTGVKVSVKGNELDVIPTEYVLEQNYPNPFNPTTMITYSLPNDGMTKLVVYNVLGEQVKVLVNEHMQAGSYTTSFDGSNISSGVYFYKLQTNNQVQIKKMLLLK